MRCGFPSDNRFSGKKELCNKRAGISLPVTSVSSSAIRVHLLLPGGEGGKGAAGIEKTPVFLPGPARQRREESEGDVHRLERLPVDPLEVADQGAECGLRRRRNHLPPPEQAGSVDTGKQPHRRRFDVTLHAGDLSREKELRPGAELEKRGEQGRGVEKGIPVDASKAGELGVFQTGDHPEDPSLFGPGQLRLKSNDIVKDAFLVFTSQLDDGMRLAARPRVDQPHGFHRPVGEGLDPTAGDRLDGKTPLEAFDLFEGVEGDLLVPPSRLSRNFRRLPDPADSSGSPPRRGHSGKRRKHGSYRWIPLRRSVRSHRRNRDKRRR